MEFITDIKNLLLKLHPRQNFLRKKFSGNSILCWDQKVHPESVMSKYEIIFYWYGIQILKAQTNIKTKCFLPNEIKSVRKNALKVACSFSIFVDLEMDWIISLLLRACVLLFQILHLGFADTNFLSDHFIIANFVFLLQKMTLT